MPEFGSFATLCRNVPSLPICNLFYRQLERAGVTLPDSYSAPVGIDAVCGIPRAGTEFEGDARLGNIANAIACGLSIVVVGWLLSIVHRRKAAVARIELQFFLLLYLISLPLQLLTTGSFLRQSTTALVVLTAIHLGVIASLFLTLLANALIATQFVEDGTLASLIPFYGFAAAFFVAVTYISLDTALGFSDAFGPSSPPSDLINVPLFVLTLIWPAIAALGFFIVMIWVVVGMLGERRPFIFYLPATVLFIASQVIYFLASKPLCRVSDAKVDGSFIATVLETISVVLVILGWRSITEESWDDPYRYQ